MKMNVCITSREVVLHEAGSVIRYIVLYQKSSLSWSRNESGHLNRIDLNKRNCSNFKTSCISGVMLDLCSRNRNDMMIQHVGHYCGTFACLFTLII